MWRAMNMITENNKPLSVNKHGVGQWKRAVRVAKAHRWYMDILKWLGK